MVVATIVASGSLGQGDIREAADRVAATGATLLDSVEIEAGKAKVEGDPEKVKELLVLLDTFPTMFNIVTP